MVTGDAVGFLEGLGVGASVSGDDVGAFEGDLDGWVPEKVSTVESAGMTSLAKPCSVHSHATER